MFCCSTSHSVSRFSLPSASDAPPPPDYVPSEQQPLLLNHALLDLIDCDSNKICCVDDVDPADAHKQQLLVSIIRSFQEIVDDSYGAAQCDRKRKFAATVNSVDAEPEDDRVHNVAVSAGAAAHSGKRKITCSGGGGTPSVCSSSGDSEEEECFAAGMQPTVAEDPDGVQRNMSESEFSHSSDHCCSEALSCCSFGEGWNQHFMSKTPRPQLEDIEHGQQRRDRCPRDRSMAMSTCSNRSNDATLITAPRSAVLREFAGVVATTADGDATSCRLNGAGELASDATSSYCPIDALSLWEQELHCFDDI